MTTVLADNAATPAKPRRRKSAGPEQTASQALPELSATDLEYKNALQHPAVKAALSFLEKAQTRRDSVHRARAGGSKFVTVEELVELEAELVDAQRPLAEIARRMPILERHALFSAALAAAEAAQGA